MLGIQKESPLFCNLDQKNMLLKYLINQSKYTESNKYVTKKKN